MERTTINKGTAMMHSKDHLGHQQHLSTYFVEHIDNMHQKHRLRPWLPPKTRLST
jgi:hypothetical protein